MRWYVLILITTLVACKKPSNETTTSEPTAPIVHQREPEPQREPTLLEQLDQYKELEGSLKLAKGHFRDTRDSIDPGAAAFSIWAAKRLVWAQLQRQPETKFALVLKDPESERGKKLCSSGSLIEIRVDRTSGRQLYVGGIVGNSGNVTRFMAAGSTGELVERSPARICGIVTGLSSYSNTGGGTTHAVNVVGMFDLPENK